MFEINQAFVNAEKQQSSLSVVYDSANADDERVQETLPSLTQPKLKPSMKHLAAKVSKSQYDPVSIRSGFLEDSADLQLAMIEKDDDKNEIDESPLLQDFEFFSSQSEEKLTIRRDQKNNNLPEECKNCAQLQKQVHKLTTQNLAVTVERNRLHSMANQASEQKQSLEAEITLKSHVNLRRLQ